MHSFAYSRKTASNLISNFKTTQKESMIMSSQQY